MKKIVLTLLALAFAGFATNALAQAALAARQHGATVGIPGMAYIRFTDGASTADVTTPSGVEFLFTTATLDVGTFAPTNAASLNWDDVAVFHNLNTAWNVQVSTAGAATFTWSKIAMTPTGVGTSAYDLGNTSTVVSDTGKTNGWRSLGIDPANYVLTLDGSEDVGTHAAVVTFTLFGP